MTRDERVDAARKTYATAEGTLNRRMEIALDAALADLGGLDALRWFSPEYHPLVLMQERDLARMEAERYGVGLIAIARMGARYGRRESREFFRLRNEAMVRHAELVLDPLFMEKHL